MENKIFDEIIKYSPLVYAIIFSLWGGTAQTVRRVRQGEIPAFSLREWIGDVVLSGFIGVVTYFFCKYVEMNEYLAIVCVSISAHMGARSIVIFEKFLTNKIEKYVDEYNKGK
ncbi:phage holin family protein [Campylobacter sp. RM9344]|uniref:Phage holin family protein n=1 Tax=Campylobacter californiensis TaxID=1032243 RepID=A0AAW3ZU35_9BACT|nr:phage holin family protein [Campylobacter sp. RM9337]MBE3030099.1 phage holin family protein [Campylobacter sp. RM9344]MBE3608782.1 phage holin family protein [Campylobacter sp. RM9337]